MIPVPDSMLLNNYNALSARAQEKKDAMHYAAMSFLHVLATTLGLPADRFFLRTHPKSKSVSGEIVLYADHLCVKLFEGLDHKGIMVQYKHTKSLNDRDGYRHYVVPITVFGRKKLSMKLVRHMQALAGIDTAAVLPGNTVHAAAEHARC